MSSINEYRQLFFAKIIGDNIANDIICETSRKPCDYRFFKKILDSSKEAIAINDPDGIFIYFNLAHQQLFGHSTDEASTLNYRDFYPPESIEVINGIIMPALSHGLGWEGELDVYDRNGRRFPLWERVDPVLDGDGNLIYMLRIMHDISRWHKAQRDLLINESHLKHAQKIANIGSFRYDRLTKHCWFSDQLQVILYNHTGTHELISIDHLRNSILPADLPIWDDAIQQILSPTYESVEIEYRILRPDHSTRTVLTILSPLLNSSDQVEGIAGTVQDITDRKAQDEEQRLFEQQLQQLQKLESLGILAGGIAHDFNNLLMTILGNTDLAHSYLPNNSPAQRQLLEIDRATQRAAELTKQLLAYSGKGRIYIEPINITDLVRSVSDILASSVSKKINIAFDVDSSVSLIDGDAAQLRQVLLNLVINAGESIGDSPGTITIRTGKQFLSANETEAAFVYTPQLPGTYVYIQVTDTGCGIDSELLSRIFDPFFTTKFSGRGLGLAAVLGIIRSHNGAISLSTDRNKGTQFTVYFPTAPDREAAVISAPPLFSTSISGATIMVVDDDPGVRTVASGMLKMLGYNSIQAEDGVQAIEALKQNGDTIAAVILDYSMPRLNGEETFRELRKVSPSLKVFLSSGYSEQEATQKFQELELVGFLHKPYKLSELKNSLNRVFSS